MLFFLLSWMAGALEAPASAPPEEAAILEANQRVALIFDDCHQQSDRSVHGALACRQARSLLKGQARQLLLSEKPWLYRDFLATFHAFQKDPLEQRSLMRIKPMESTPSSVRFQLTGPKIRYVLECNRGLDRCGVTQVEWPVIEPELVCTSPLPSMSGYRLSVLKSLENRRVAEQFLEAGAAPTRIEVQRRADLQSGRIFFSGEGLLVEADLPPWLRQPRWSTAGAHSPLYSEAVNHSLPLFEHPLPLDCFWRAEAELDH